MTGDGEKLVSPTILKYSDEAHSFILKTPIILETDTHEYLFVGFKNK
jgi:hypothetical protein